MEIKSISPSVDMEARLYILVEDSDKSYYITVKLWIDTYKPMSILDWDIKKIEILKNEKPVEEYSNGEWEQWDNWDKLEELITDAVPVVW